MAMTFLSRLRQKYDKAWGSKLYFHLAPRKKQLSSEYWPRTNFKNSISANMSISTKLKNSRYRPNLASESRLRFYFITSTKHQQQNTDQTPASNLAWTSTSKSWPNLVLKVWTKVLLYDQIYNKLLPTRSSLSTSATITASTSFELIGLRSDKTDPGFSICLHFYFPSLCPISLLLLSVCSSPAPPLLSFIIQAPTVSY